MKIFYTFLKTLRTLFLATVIAGGAFFSYSFYDSEFEISKNLDIFVTLFKELNLLYVDETNPGELMKTGIDAMLGSLDPYTNYIPESDIEDYRFITTGQYGGIGAGIRRIDGQITVAEPYEGFPAHKAGIIAGDIILKINGKDTKDKTTAELSKILKGQPNTAVKLVLKRPGQEELMEKSILRQSIKVNDVSYYGMLNDHIGYIRLDKFTETASSEVKKAYAELLSKNELRSLVLDLRGNGGGLLREAVSIVNIFVDKNQEVVHTKGKRKEWDQIHRTLDNPIDTDVPLVILTDAGSASASEIVAGTIQDLDRGVLVGQQSFGKGLVQQTRPLEYNSQLKVTVAKYYIPSGRCIQRLDYSSRNDKGKAEAVPDSLIQPFTTRKGRLVYDGAGITPDVKVETDLAAHVTASLVRKNHIFHFATDFRQKNDEIPDPEKWMVSDKDYDGFVKFLDGKDYSYTTKSEQLLEDLSKATKKEKYFDAVQKEYDSLSKQIAKNKSDDLVQFKGEVKEVLSNEIVGRYYLQEGRIKHTLSIDPDILKAVEVLEDKEMYRSILDGTYEPASKN